MCILMLFFKLIKVHLLVSELHIYQNARCNNKKMLFPFWLLCSDVTAKAVYVLCSVAPYVLPEV